MTTINQLSTVDDLSTADQFVLYRTVDGYSKKASFNSLLNFIKANGVFSNNQLKQYSIPTTGFNLQIGNIGDTQSYANNIWLILTPIGTLSTGTLTLPPIANAMDLQEVLVNSTQTITTLSFNLNGATSGIGLPTTITANGFFRLRLDRTTSTWYRI